MTLQALAAFLRDARVPYTLFRHPAAFTAQDEAAVSHVPGRSWAKVVACFADEEAIMAVLPAHLMVDLEQLRVLAESRAIRLASETECAALYPDCEPGAMPPFGGLYHQRVFLERSLVGDPDLVFNSGTHTVAVRMHAGDLVELTHPLVGRFARPSEIHQETRSGARRRSPARERNVVVPMRP